MNPSIMPQYRKCQKAVLIVRILLIAVIICNLLFIWMHSAKVSTESDKTSKKLATNVAKVVVEDYESLPKTVQQKHVNRLNTKLRSFGHFAEFVPLGILLFLLALTLVETADRNILHVFGFCLLFSVALSALVALGDEVHQIFVKGRTFQLQDILVDTLGSLTGCVAAILSISFFKNKIFG